MFTSAAATAFPVKGSAILWFNTFSDGTSDQDTQHGACPVVMGQKWGESVLGSFHILAL